ncbi:hypothetical protein V2J09_023214 [Rumex salicifolius]
MQRISISSTPSCSNAGPDDLESLGDLYVWGELWSDGPTTESPSRLDILIPKPLETDVVLDVHQISCGVRHISLVTRQGEVFTWGEESGGRLGHGIAHDLNRPRLVEFLAVTNVDFVACGEFHTCAISTQGDLFTWGDGTYNAGLLGQGTEASHWIPKRVSGPMDGLQVLLVACGVWHSAMITSPGRLFTFGDGRFGVLGHGNRDSVLLPKEVQQLSKLKSIKVACGVWHTAAIVEVSNSLGPNSNISSRKLFTWGDGDKYRLGHANKETYLYPTCVSSLVDYNFHQIACGHVFTVALTTSGHVFTMGSNLCGGQGKEPSLVKDKLVGEFVEEIACGASHVAVLTSRSEVFTWGKGANGQLGHGDVEDRKSPTLVDALKDRHVKSIACGSNFSSCICIHKWVSGADQSVCSGCRQAFGFTRKRHNCYNCGIVHCHGCSSKKALKAALAPTPNKPHRVCDACYNKLKSSVVVGSGSTFSKKATGARRSVDLTREKFDYGYEANRPSRIMLTSPIEPMKYQRPVTESESLLSAFQQMKDIAFQSSTNIRPLSTIPPAPMLPINVSSSRLASAYIRKPALPSNSITLSSRNAIDSLKKSNEGLSNEVRKLQSQNKTLREKWESRTEENKILLQRAREANTLASKQSSRCKVAEEIMKLVTTQLDEMAEMLPSDINENNGFMAMRLKVHNFLEENETGMLNSHLPLLEEVVNSSQQVVHHSSSDDNSDDSVVIPIPQKSEPASDESVESHATEDDKDVDHSDNSGANATTKSLVSNDDYSVCVEDNLRAGETPQNSEHSSYETIESTASEVDYTESSRAREKDTEEPTSSSRKTDKKPSNNVNSTGRATEVIEQFEPGVYVTVVQLRNDVKFFRRVRFSKKRFAEKQAEEWWKGNKERVLKKFPPPHPAPVMKQSGPPEDRTPVPPPPIKESNGANTST